MWRTTWPVAQYHHCLLESVRSASQKSPEDTRDRDYVDRWVVTKLAPNGTERRLSSPATT